MSTGTAHESTYTPNILVSNYARDRLSRLNETNNERFLVVDDCG